MNEDMWVRIFYKGSKYKGAVKAAFCDIESNDLMWHDFFWIKHYGAKKPVPEKLARKAKRVGFAQPGEWRHGVRTYVLLLAKGKANVVRSGSCFGEQERRHRFGEQDKDKSLSGSNHPGAFLRQSITYVNHYGQVHRVIFMLVALQR